MALAALADEWDRRARENPPRNGTDLRVFCAQQSWCETLAFVANELRAALSAPAPLEPLELVALKEAARALQSPGWNGPWDACKEEQLRIARNLLLDTAMTWARTEREAKGGRTSG